MSSHLSDFGDAVFAEYSDVSDDEMQLDRDPDSKDDMSSILNNLGDYFGMKEATGPDTVPKLANIVNAWFRSVTSLEKTKSLSERFSRPGNCDNMTIPNINDQIYITQSASLHKY